jgi:hypothetical protein
VGQGLRADLERLDGDALTALVQALARRGVAEAVIREALAEATGDLGGRGAGSGPHGS